MPRLRLLTDAQEDAALAMFRAGNGKRGTNARLAREHNCSDQGMHDILKRAAARASSQVSHETGDSSDPQL